MEKVYNIDKIIKSGEIQNEFDLEIAMVCDRLLRLLIKENPQLKAICKRLRDIIEDYETKNWSSDSTVTPNQIKESDLAELNVKKEMHEIKQSLLQYVQHNLS